ncbi:hypothetical protein LTR56_026808 [Elasticomyces elasticus]|nr:hypothetical protein LTR56_026808 [Elasticomyces elasticus]
MRVHSAFKKTIQGLAKLQRHRRLQPDPNSQSDSPVSDIPDRLIDFWPYPVTRPVELGSVELMHCVEVDIGIGDEIPERLSPNSCLRSMLLDARLPAPNERLNYWITVNSMPAACKAAPLTSASGMTIEKVLDAVVTLKTKHRFCPYAAPWQHFNGYVSRVTTFSKGQVTMQEDDPVLHIFSQDIAPGQAHCTKLELCIAAMKDAFEAGLAIPTLDQWENDQVSPVPAADSNMSEEVAYITADTSTLTSHDPATSSPRLNLTATTKTDTPVNLKGVKKKKAVSESVKAERLSSKRDREGLRSGRDSKVARTKALILPAAPAAATSKRATALRTNQCRIAGLY